MTPNNLCNSCTNIGCKLQSGIVRTKCAFYMSPNIEPDNCGNYVVMREEEEIIKGHCKDCKYFEYDSVAKVDEIPLIVAHEICNKWGNGCKTKEDGYCFMFEPQESEE